MILPMSAFFLTIAILGRFIIVRAGRKAGDAKLLPIGFSMLFAGMGYCLLALFLYPLAYHLGTVWGFALLFFVPFAGALVGAILGYRSGIKRRIMAQG